MSVYVSLGNPEQDATTAEGTVVDVAWSGCNGFVRLTLWEDPAAGLVTIDAFLTPDLARRIARRLRNAADAEELGAVLGKNGAGL